MAHRYVKNRRGWPSPPQGKRSRRLVAAGSRINGEVKLAISPEILKKTEGLPWHARIARISAITGKPFVVVREALES
jgi:hypothetical protein